MSFDVKVIADSEGLFGCRAFTVLPTFPRYILAEINTHRMIAKNSASSRAIPFKKMVEAVKNNPFIPIAWPKDHKGMQATEYITNKEHIDFFTGVWLAQRDLAIQSAEELNGGILSARDGNGDRVKIEDGITKQFCNRLLEPFMYHTALLTATEWENFFAQRCPRYFDTYKIKDPDGTFREDSCYYRSKKDFLCSTGSQYLDPLKINWLERNKGGADIHMMQIAEMLWDAYNTSEPKKLKAGEWHLPFGEINEGDRLFSFSHENYAKRPEELKVKIVTARCARTSYTVIGEESKTRTYKEDIDLCNRLIYSNPKHMSPADHPAKCMSEEEFFSNFIRRKVPYEYLEGIRKDIELGITKVVNTRDEDGVYIIEYGWCKHMRGFIPYRNFITGENKR